MPADAHRPQLVSVLPSAFSSPYVRQVHHEVGWASGLLDEEFLDELYRDLRLLRDREWAGTFSVYDSSVLRARVHSVAIPPPAPTRHSAETSAGAA
eukprot:7817480-Pyramimonas_sp.AAC.1